MRLTYCLPVVALALVTMGCEPDTMPSDGSSTTIVAPPATHDGIDVDVGPQGGVSVDTDAPATPGDKPVDVDIQPGGGVDVDVNPGEVGERIRERREERREAAENP